MVQAPLGGGGQVGLRDGEVGQSLQGAPGTAGGALLDFDGSDVSFCLVVVLIPTLLILLWVAVDVTLGNCSWSSGEWWAEAAAGEVGHGDQ